MCGEQLFFPDSCLETIKTKPDEMENKSRLRRIRKSAYQQ